MTISKAAYNPFDDPELHTTVPEPDSEFDLRRGFNDVIRHADIINGHQVPKQIDQYPRKWRKTLRWGILVYVVMTIAAIAIAVVDSMT